MTDEQKKLRESIANVLSRQSHTGAFPVSVTRDQLDRAVREIEQRREPHHQERKR